MNLTEIIKDIILSQGPIPFKDYMKKSLYHPEYGYYCKGDFPGGSRGDFVTSPHTTRLFGALITNQILEFMELLNLSGNKFTIVEIGAGAGHLASDIISSLNDNQAKVEELSYVIVEPIPHAIEQQKGRLSGTDFEVKWVDKIEDIGTFKGCVISNELIDAFPVDVVQKTDDGFRELYVDIDHNGDFKEVLFEIEKEELIQYCRTFLSDLPSPYRTEINFGIKSFLADVSAVMDEGFILTIDYGYTRSEYLMPHRNRGTLLGYYHQQVVDNVLQYPGLIDITAHVNFSDMNMWGMEMGFEPCGFNKQYAFLGGLDFEETFNKIYGKVDPFSPEMAAVKMLIMPHGMGESHRVLVQSKGFNGNSPKLKGFQFANYIQSL